MSTTWKLADGMAVTGTDLVVVVVVVGNSVPIVSSGLCLFAPAVPGLGAVGLSSLL